MSSFLGQACARKDLCYLIIGDLEKAVNQLKKEFAEQKVINQCLTQFIILQS